MYIFIIPATGQSPVAENAPFVCMNESSIMEFEQTLALLLLVLIQRLTPASREFGRNLGRASSNYVHLAKLRERKRRQKAGQREDDDVGLLNRVLGPESWATHALINGMLIGLSLFIPTHPFQSMTAQHLSPTSPFRGCCTCPQRCLGTQQGSGMRERGCWRCCWSGGSLVSPFLTRAVVPGAEPLSGSLALPSWPR